MISLYSVMKIILKWEKFNYMLEIGIVRIFTNKDSWVSWSPTKTFWVSWRVIFEVLVSK